MTDKPITTEQRQARRAADRALQQQARETLADPDAVAAMVAQLAEQNRSPKVLRYSLRNQALLNSQAADRGISLTDVDTFRGWSERGRCVCRGERGLRIVAPKGRETEEQEEQESGHEEEGGEESRTRFRMTAVLDICQTEGLDDAEQVGDAHEVPNPAAVLAETLTDQLERLGYDIEERPEVEHGEVDDGNLVTVPAGRPVAELARALAVIITADKADQKASTTSTM